MQAVQEYLSQKFNFDISSFSLTSSHLQAGAIIFLVFLLLLTFASVRRHFLEWSFKGAWFGLFLGFLLALILEGFLIVGGRTAITEILGWKNAPQPLLGVIDAGRNKLVNVLGVTDEIPSSVAKEKTTFDEFVDIFQTLNPDDQKKARSLICAP